MAEKKQTQQAQQKKVVVKGKHDSTLDVSPTQPPIDYQDWLLH